DEHPHFASDAPAPHVRRKAPTDPRCGPSGHIVQTRERYQCDEYGVPTSPQVCRRSAQGGGRGLIQRFALHLNHLRGGHDLPRPSICPAHQELGTRLVRIAPLSPTATRRPRSEEHTSELQSRENLVCRLL